MALIRTSGKAGKDNITAISSIVAGSGGSYTYLVTLVGYEDKARESSSAISLTAKVNDTKNVTAYVAAGANASYVTCDQDYDFSTDKENWTHVTANTHSSIYNVYLAYVK